MKVIKYWYYSMDLRGKKKVDLVEEQFEEAEEIWQKITLNDEKEQEKKKKTITGEKYRVHPIIML